MRLPFLAYASPSPLVAAVALAVAQLAVATSPARADGKPAGAVFDEDMPARADAKAPAKTGWQPPISTKSDLRHYALGVYGRGVLLTKEAASGLFATNANLYSGAVGLQFTRRKGDFEVVTSLDYSNYAGVEGNFLWNGNSAKLDTHHVELRNTGVVSLDVSFHFTHDFTQWLALILGGGVGLGVMTGDIWLINNSGTVCTTMNATDVSSCFPVVDPKVYTAYGNPVPTWTNAQGKEVAFTAGAIKPDDPDYHAKLNGLATSQSVCQNAPKQGDCRDTAEHPYFRKVSLPVVPVINVTLGLRFKLERHWNLNLTGGFRTATFFVGGGPEYVF